MTPPEQDYKGCLRVLELDEGVTVMEIKSAYKHLRALYSRDSIATLPLLDTELTPERRREILADIDRAYARITELMDRDRIEQRKGLYESVKGGRVKEELKDVERFDGAVLRGIRERLGLSLLDIERATKVQAKYLDAIEREDFGELPEAVFVRGYVTSYARFFGLDTGRVVSDYMGVYHRAGGGER